MKPVFILAMCMLFAFTAQSQQTVVSTITLWNPTTQKMETISALTQLYTPPQRNKISFEAPKVDPIKYQVDRPLSWQVHEFNTPAYTVTPYTKSAQYGAAQNAMQMLDAIISPKKN